MVPEIICFPRWRLVYLLKFLRTPELNVANGDTRAADGYKMYDISFKLLAYYFEKRRLWDPDQ